MQSILDNRWICVCFSIAVWVACDDLKCFWRVVVDAAAQHARLQQQQKQRPQRRRPRRLVRARADCSEKKTEELRESLRLCLLAASGAVATERKLVAMWRAHVCAPLQFLWALALAPPTSAHLLADLRAQNPWPRTMRCAPKFSATTMAL